MTKPDDYLWDGSGEADPDVAKLEELLRPLAHDRPMDELRMRRAKRRRAPWIMAGIAAIAAAAVLVLFLRRGGTPSGCEGGEGFEFRADGGAVSCGGASVAQGVLPVGGVLDTGTARARLAIANIGSAELSPQTRVRLSRTAANERHELHLERGKMHAKVDAPPRIFAVTTASTSVVDLGCEYTIDIDDKGAGSIIVMSGMVELASDPNASGGIVVAPAGTDARLLAGRKPSLPVSSTASAELRAAVATYEQSGVIDDVLAKATEEDAITIVNLAVLRADLRPRVLARLAELVPPPEGVTIESASSTPAALARWQEDVLTMHFGNRVLREMMPDD